MQIRRATMNDIEELLRMARSFVQYSGVEGLEMHPASCVSLVQMLTTQENAALFVADDQDGTLAGMIGGMVAPQLFNHTRLEATEFCWWVEEDHRNGGLGPLLLGTFEKWAKEAGARSVRMAVLEGPLHDMIAAVYKRRGYKPVEHHFGREV